MSLQMNDSRSKCDVEVKCSQTISVNNCMILLMCVSVCVCRDKGGDGPGARVQGLSVHCGCSHARENQSEMPHFTGNSLSTRLQHLGKMHL